MMVLVICSLCLTEFGVLLVAVSCPQAHSGKFRVNPGNSLVIRQGHIGFFIAQGPNEVRRQVTIMMMMMMMMMIRYNTQIFNMRSNVVRLFFIYILHSFFLHIVLIETS